MRKSLSVYAKVLLVIFFINCSGSREMVSQNLDAEIFLNSNKLENRSGVSFVSGSEEPFSGDVRDSSGSILKHEGHYRDGLKDGIWIYYYDNGNVKQEGVFQNNTKSGSWITYDGNSTKTTLEQYKNDILDGLSEEYKLIIKRKVSYKMGKRQGSYSELNQENQLSSEGTYRDDKKDGIWNELVEDGYRDYTTYSNGIKHGLYTRVFPSGRTQVSGNFKDGKKGGDWTQKTEAGQILKQRSYSNNVLEYEELYRVDGTRILVKSMKKNKLHGEYEEYFSNDQLKIKGEYALGKKDGAWLSWADNGILLKEENYKVDIRNGEQKFFFSNGNLEKYQNFSMGLLHGESKEWNDKGVLRAQGYYTLGEIVGVKKTWYQNGNPEAEISYRKGIEEGHILKWWENGNLKEAGAKKSGDNIGIWSNFNPSGVLETKIDYSSLGS